MRPEYKEWLQEQKYAPNTIVAQMHRVGRVEECYGNLDDHARNGTLQDIIDNLTYSTDDERRNKPNPSKIPFEGNIRNNLQAYKNAVVRYRKFLTGWERSDSAPPLDAPPVERAEIESDISGEQTGRKLSLERDMQAALRLNIGQLGSTLRIVDDGAERSVHSGLIDITCEDQKNGALIVVELKAGKADSRAIGQILGYMGDLAEEEEGRVVKGILVAHEFDKRCKSAAKVVPTLVLMRYAVEFSFEAEG
jgi:hypothetical protein